MPLGASFASRVIQRGSASDCRGRWLSWLLRFGPGPVGVVLSSGVRRGEAAGDDSGCSR
jgi:hypothetical protein